ncbi:thiamine pyrophosphate-dependent dehydrogenase E1 component subunit alpha [Rubritalea marina]|uniref:thiamine pyrophosphate-dependent dehydrogenase E1 component subunit alpha n=1 Tax=Rubritalea marina TaxID=361055 RepID=UPI00036E329F|nr:thiamine pyrophosphate-dependent dehydrogenase E1 component subunit alpha [Rubritalea marina]
MSEAFDPIIQHGAPTQEYVRRVMYAMLRGRIMETKLSNLYKAGKIVGGVYLGKGQEAVSASLGAALRMGHDVFAPLIRDQAGRMAFGEASLDATRTYLGSAQGPMRGRDGNIHRGRPDEGLYAMISHLGAAVSQVGGALLAKRIQGTLGDSVGATCVGDGATSTGAFHEGLNFVAVERLPMVVIIADNQYAYSTPNERQYACEDLVDRAKGYGVAGHSVDGTNVLECARVIGGAVAAARSGEGPQLVVAKLLRLGGHGEHDDGSYVEPELRQGHLGRDCIEVGKELLIQNGLLTAEQYDAWVQEISEECQEAVAVAQREEGPNPYSEDWSATSSLSLRGLK